MKKTLYILSSVAVLALAACEKQIDIDIEDQQQMIVANAQGVAGEPLELSLTYSRPMFGSFYVAFDESYFPAISDATVSLRVNGGGTITASHIGGNYSFPHTPQPGEELELTIAVPGREPLVTTTSVPQEPLVDEIRVGERESSPDIDNNTSVDYTVTIPLTDRGGTTDYYSIKMYIHDTAFYTYYDNNGAAYAHDTMADNRDWFECQDQLIVSGINIDDALEGVAVPTFYGSEMLFNDALIDGTTHSIDLQTDLNLGYLRYNGGYINGEYNPNFTYTVRGTIYVEVSSLSRDHYLYLQTMDSYDYDELMGLFSEPVQIHSNIDGGIGIFAVKAKKTFSHRFEIDQQ